MDKNLEIINEIKKSVEEICDEYKFKESGTLCLDEMESIINSFKKYIPNINNYYIAMNLKEHPELEGIKKICDVEIIDLKGYAEKGKIYLLKKSPKYFTIKFQ